ncbi:unnamed protein product [Tilletia laevis]|uniref:glucan 1,3-beta-glucosidase n=2 Tax=Tilletia TaxID=13289 RepID=A0A177TYF5_9BASI|nr:hypothetical protein CF336_g8848 [Tilletia laevis]KAE8240252.1 hypothetical protein A4X03_0g8566 [Tilletia caries]KAE8185410.1 hypothetical protein CF335_g7728 [Tilletia laevis]CAD6884145.1 unnamed protein product [Tilletia caries]CAD6910202.1 unnamed protein product [Tilletia laevis]
MASQLRTSGLNENASSPRPSSQIDNEQGFFLASSEQPQQQGATTASDAYHSNTPGAPSIASNAALGPAAGAGASRGSYSGVPTNAVIDEKRYQPKNGVVAFIKRKPWVLVLLALIVVAAIAGGVAGGVAGSKKGSSSNSKSGSGSGNGNSNAGNTADGGNNGNNTDANTNVTAPIIPLQRWDWTSKTNKAYGVNIGNWILLERWLDEDHFTSQCDYCGDEYSWAQAMGKKAAPALQEHFQTWFVESDLDFLQSYGVNTVRVPVGYWSLIPNVQGEPFVNAGQMDYLGKLLTWLHKRGMYATISLHGLPGSQSGDQSTGRSRSPDVGGSGWFTPNNMKRSDAAVSALADWIAQQGNYSSVVSAVLPVNEPKQTDQYNAVNDDWQQQLVDYYERSYKTLVQHGIVMAIHPGYYQGQDPSGWQGFVNGKDANMLVWEAHPYPGFFPTEYDDSVIMSKVCNLASIQSAISVPIYFGEWSMLSGVTTPGWLRKYFGAQIQAYNQGAGSTIWTWKANNSTQGGKGGYARSDAEMGLYDFKNLVNMGIIPKPDSPQNIMSTLQGQYKDACNYNGRRSLGGDSSRKRMARSRVAA